MAFNSTAGRSLRYVALVAGCFMLSAERGMSGQTAWVFAMPRAAVAGGSASHSASGSAYLGVNLRNVSDSSVSSLHLRETHGVVITDMDHDGPACKAGLRVHDVVQSIDGMPMDSEEQLRRTLGDMQPGRRIQIGISRDGSPMTMTATMANRDDVGKIAWEGHYIPPAPEDTVILDDNPAPSDPPSRASRSFGHNFMPGHLLPYFPSYTGITVDEIGPQLAEYFGLRGGKGLLVKSVDANSPAAAAGMHAGDIVLRVNGAGMATHADWNRALHDSKGHVVSVVVMREHREQTLTVVPDSKRKGAVQQPGQPVQTATRSPWLAVLLFR